MSISTPPDMNEIIPYGRHNINDADIDAVIEVLKSDWLTQGPKVREFEDAFAKYIGVDYAVAVSNGTAGLHLSALALNVKPGDKVITTPITFAASANCVRYCGGEVVFADIDPETYLLDLVQVKKLLESSPPGTYKGIIPVDFAGRSVNMEELRILADEFDLWIIEDACHAPGGFFIDSNGKKQNCGNGIFADLSVFSFHPVKHIACGEGGMITTNNGELYLRLKKLRNHGIQRDPEFFEFNHGIWYYEMQELGFNYRITDIQSALGISQLKRADEGMKRRREIAEVYDKTLKGKPFITGQSGIVDGHAYHLYIIEVDDRKGLITHLREHNIISQVHYIPVHMMPYYRKLGWKEGDLCQAESYYHRCLSLPMFPALGNDEQHYVCEKIIDYFV